MRSLVRVRNRTLEHLETRNSEEVVVEFQDYSHLTAYSIHQHQQRAVEPAPPLVTVHQPYIGVSLGEGGESAAAFLVRASPPEDVAKYQFFGAVCWAPGTPYQTVRADLFEHMQRYKPFDEALLVLNTTHVGWPVRDLFRGLTEADDCVTVAMAGGATVECDARTGVWRVPRADLAGMIRAVFAAKRLRIEDDAIGAQAMDEIRRFSVKEVPGATEHIATSLAVALWWGERHGDDFDGEVPFQLEVRTVPAVRMPEQIADRMPR
jgi:hypothetical protein